VTRDRDGLFVRDRPNAGIRHQNAGPTPHEAGISIDFRVSVCPRSDSGNDSDEAIRNIVPQGYRTGLVTAITVFLGFSLYFARFWNLEHSGEWTWIGVVSAGIVGVGIVVQLLALFRSLDLRDQMAAHYNGTVRCFFAGIVIVLLGVIIATVVA
jgi:hypothetical protein